MIDCASRLFRLLLPTFALAYVHLPLPKSPEAAETLHSYVVLHSSSSVSAPQRHGIEDSQIDLLDLGQSESTANLMLEHAPSVTSILSALAQRGRYQDAIEVLRSLKKRRPNAEPTPLQYHKAILACKTAQKWSLAMELLAEMRQMEGMQILLHTYGAVMDVCASAGQLDMALKVADWMEDSGIPLNKVAYTTLIKACATAGQGHRALGVLERLRASHASLDYLGYLKTINVLGSSGLLQEAGDLLQAMRQDERIAADYRVYHSLLRDAIVQKRIDLAVVALQCMHQDGYSPSSHAHRSLWDSLIKDGHTATALQVVHNTGLGSIPLAIRENLYLRLLLHSGDHQVLLQQLQTMARQNVELRDERLINGLVRHFCQDDKAVDVSSVLALMRGLAAVHAQVDVVDYTTAITALGRQGKEGITAALSLVDRMKAEGVKPNEVTYTSLIYLLGQAGKFERARQLLIDMQGEGVRPSTITISALMHSYTNAGLGHEALALFEELPAMGLAADIRVYTSLLRTLLAMDRPQDVFDTFERIMAEGLKPEGRSFSILAKAYFAQKNWRAALGLIKRAEEMKIELDAMFFTVLVDGLACAGQLSRAHEAIRLMKERGIEPNSFTYSALLKGCAQQDPEGLEIGRLKERMATFDMAVRDGLQPNIVIYNALIEGCARARDTTAALNYFQQLRNFHLKPDVITWTVLIKAHAYSGNFTGAFDLIREMQTQGGVQPSERTFNPLIDRCARAGRMDLVDKALNMMRRSARAHPDVVTYNSIITGLMVRSQYQEAEQLVEDLGQEQMAFNTVTLNIFVDHYAKAGLFDKALEFLQRTPRAGMRADTQTFNHLLDGLARVGRYKQARNAFLQMREAGVVLDTFTAMIMLSVHSKEDDHAGFDILVSAMRDHDIYRDASITSMLVRSYLHHKRPEDAIALLEGRRKAGVTIQRSLYSFILGHLLEQGRSEEAFQYLEELGRNKPRILLDGFCYAILSRDVLGRGQTDLAWTLIRDMRDRGVMPSAELLPLLAELWRRKEGRQEAEQLGEGMVQTGIVTPEQLRVAFPEGDERQRTE